jgi:hypothetical protein
LEFAIALNASCLHAFAPCGFADQALGVAVKPSNAEALWHSVSLCVCLICVGIVLPGPAIGNRRPAPCRFDPIFAILCGRAAPKSADRRGSAFIDRFQASLGRLHTERQGTYARVLRDLAEWCRRRGRVRLGAIDDAIGNRRRRNSCYTPTRMRIKGQLLASAPGDPVPEIACCCMQSTRRNNDLP